MCATRNYWRRCPTPMRVFSLAHGCSVGAGCVDANKTANRMRGFLWSLLMLPLLCHVSFTLRHEQPGLPSLDDLVQQLPTGLRWVTGVRVAPLTLPSWRSLGCPSSVQCPFAAGGDLNMTWLTTDHFGIERHDGAFVSSNLRLLQPGNWGGANTGLRRLDASGSLRHFRRLGPFEFDGSNSNRSKSPKMPKRTSKTGRAGNLLAQTQDQTLVLGRLQQVPTLKLLRHRAESPMEALRSLRSEMKSWHDQRGLLPPLPPPLHELCWWL